MSLLGEDIRYVLSVQAEKKACFFVTVEYRGESVSVSVGTDVSEANKIFDVLVLGNVTPCTVADVVADLLYSFAI